MVNDLLQASNSGHMYILSLLDLSAAFDTIDHDILIKRLHTTSGCSGTVLDWFTYLSFRTQSGFFFFFFFGHASTLSALKCGVPQGLVLGPLLFLICTRSLLALSFVHQTTHTISLQMIPSSTTRVHPQTSQLLSMVLFKDCIADVAEWMCDSMLKMNHDKTELIAIGTKPKISQVTLSLTPVFRSDHNIPFSQSVRNLGVLNTCVVFFSVSYAD